MKISDLIPECRIIIHVGAIILQLWTEDILKQKLQEIKNLSDMHDDLSNILSIKAALLKRDFIRDLNKKNTEDYFEEDFNLKLNQRNGISKSVKLAIKDSAIIIISFLALINSGDINPLKQQENYILAEIIIDKFKLSLNSDVISCPIGNDCNEKCEDFHIPLFLFENHDFPKVLMKKKKETCSKYVKRCQKFFINLSPEDEFYKIIKYVIFFLNLSLRFN